ncbi:BTAD domain-containing putative transcriptional regulator [Micromonospora sp. WMMD882]|uniref:AfsR/SARP family transcriptional regulator n=1 Tax=Micromonospora sp. WMMD882 TaxID=3015151 RepID=UPI00248B928C|nr:BTAD domain-containing putative transcriptional regulator [Micromonospora sp. WMMD882]WBB78409.1 BTAD domain-containing putative transcriptional regulator [Micromonospora sp. WMMD882]
MELYFRALGPVAVESGGTPVDLGGPQRTLVLALLLAHANQPVPVDLIVDELWPDSPPRSHRVQLQGLVSDLRRRLSPGGSRAAAPIVTSSSAYQLQVAPEQCDLDQFRAAVAAAETARGHGDTAAAIRLLRAALRLWRGPAFSGLSGLVIELSAAALNEARTDAIAAYVDARLADGQLAGLTPELVRLVAEHPLDERFARQLMTAHSRVGRRSDALTVFRELRRRTVTELGAEPSEQTRELHRRIVTGDPGPSGRPGPDTGHADGAGQPPDAGRALASAYRHLPPDITEFVGRRAELAAVRDISVTDTSETAVPVVTIEGMAGVGKTRLAVHAAHRLTGAYPDGQLYVDLRGFTADAAPADPAEVLESLLRLLGVPASSVPATVEARAAVFRDRLSGQRVLLVLDNAADEAQLLPLLPTGPGCLVIVTSRRSLAVDGAHPIRLDVLDRTESWDLLTMILGPDRVTAEPAAADALLTCCGHLPLAVAIAARRLRARPAWQLGHLVTRLTDENHRLDELHAGGRAVESVLALSYRALTPERRRQFRLLGVHPGNDVTAASVAALVGADRKTARDALESLLDEHLLQQVEPHRYQLHDLLREYAGRRCAAEDPAGVGPARERLLDWYVATVDAATRLIRRYPVLPVGLPPTPRTPPERFADEPEALAWLDAEYPNILAAIRAAPDGVGDRHVLRLAHLLPPYLIRKGHLDDWRDVLLRAEAVARRTGDRGAEAYTLTMLGQAYDSAGRTEPALARLAEALALHQRLGQLDGEGITRNQLGLVYRRLGRHRAAVDEYRRAIALLRSDLGRQWTATVLSNLGIDLHLLGRDREALTYIQQALALQRRSGGPGVASMEINLGLLYARLGRHAEAIRHSRRALLLMRRRWLSRPGQANALANLALSHIRLGRPGVALRSGRAALDLARGLSPDLQANVWNTLGEAYLLAGHRAAARRSHRVAQEIADRINEADEQARARAGLAKATGRRPRPLPDARNATGRRPRPLPGTGVVPGGTVGRRRDTTPRWRSRSSLSRSGRVAGAG